MNLDLRYLGASEVQASGSGATLRFSPNLARSRVFFDAELAYPIRFREAVSALHDVVVGDLRFKERDKTAYLAWKKEQAQNDTELRRALFDKAKQAELARIAREPIPKDLDGDFRKMHRLYWDARVRWANELSRNDPELFRHLVPCDPVVTVAPDVVFFECFSKDESAYGCLTVDREALRGADAGLGTTNVDYSLALYDHFQTLRTYRSTRLLVDPTGFEVKVEGREDYREEKIDLPPSWLRGFAQLQAAMTLPSRKVELTVESVYSILAHLKRHKERTGPRSLRFQLAPGKAPALVLDPWGVTHPLPGPRRGRRAARGARRRSRWGETPHTPRPSRRRAGAVPLSSGHRVRCWPTPQRQARGDQGLGPSPALRAGAGAPSLRPHRGAAARHRHAQHLDRPPRRDAPLPRALRVDGQRLDLRCQPGAPRRHQSRRRAHHGAALEASSSRRNERRWTPSPRRSARAATAPSRRCTSWPSTGKRFTISRPTAIGTREVMPFALSEAVPLGPDHPELAEGRPHRQDGRGEGSPRGGARWR